jgi:predicted AAA+ superfamily ATPase
MERESLVFDKSRRDVVLDITDLAENKIDPDDFFAENYLTDGMKRLLENAFLRFELKSQQGLYRLTQAMGAGQTHTMLALGLPAKRPKFRVNVMGDLYRAKDLGSVRVVAFSGRQNPQEGLWGEIAEQLGKKEFFKDRFSNVS